MKSSAWVLALIAFIFLSVAPGTHTSYSAEKRTESATTMPASGTSVYEKLPITFEPNFGQLNPRIQFTAKADAYMLFITGPEAVFVPKSGSADGTVRLTFVNGNPHPAIDGLEIQQGRTNYFLGDDATGWRTNIPLYASIRFHEIYPGIDLIFYGRNRELEYDLILQPGADPKQVKVRFDGATDVRLNGLGDLIVRNDAFEMTQQRPQIYQIVDGARLPVGGGFAINRNNEVSFRFDPIRREAALVIDPVVTYSSYLGGRNKDVGLKIRTDNSGAIYVAGLTDSFRDFPGPLRLFGDVDITTVAFITKLAPDGKSIVYSITYGQVAGGPLTLGGFAVDSLGQSYLAGGAMGHLPTTADAFQPSSQHQNAFVAKFDPTGSRLIYGTFIGGTTSISNPGRGYDYATDLAVDASGNAYVVGYTGSTDFPVKNAYQSTGGGSAFVSKLNATGSKLIFSTYLGHQVYENGIHVTIDAWEHVYVTGRTLDPNFPITPGAFQTQRTFNIGPGGTRPAPDAFITKLNPSGTALVFSTFFGGAGVDGFYTEVVNAISVDTANNVYLTGWTDSPQFPQAAAPSGSSCGITSDAFFTKMDGSGSRLIYSWCEPVDRGPSEGVAIVPDSSQNAYTTLSFRVPAAAAVVVRKLSTTGQVIREQKLNGSAEDFPHDLTLHADHIAYVTGETFSTDFPTVGAFQNSNHGGGDAFIAAIDFSEESSRGTFTRLEQTNSAIEYSGQWYSVKNSIFSGGSASTAVNAGSRATFTFNGTAARWVGYKDPWSGIAKVYIDGVLKTQVDTYSPLNQAQALLYSVAGLPSASHTLTIEITGMKNQSSKAFWVWLDAVEYK